MKTLKTSAKRLGEHVVSSNHLTNVDPYWVWADLTDLRGMAPRFRGETVEVFCEFPLQESDTSQPIFRHKSVGWSDVNAWMQTPNSPAQLNGALRVELAAPDASPAPHRQDESKLRELVSDAYPKVVGKVMAVIDFGCPFLHECFRTAGGKRSRVAYFWDQNKIRTPPDIPSLSQLLTWSNGAEGDPKESVFSNFAIDMFFKEASGPWTKDGYDATRIAMELTYPQKLLDYVRATVIAESGSSYWRPLNLSVSARSPKLPRAYGRELLGEDIERLLKEHKGKSEGEIYAAAEYELMSFGSSHGAHVLSIAAGVPNPLARDDAKSAVAEDNAPKIIFVQLPFDMVADSSGRSLAGYVHDAIEYVLARTHEDANVVVNLSYGSYAGPHDGSALIEKAMDAAIERGRGRGKGSFDIVVAAGNSFQAACHASVRVNSGQPASLQWDIMPDDETESFLELWIDSAATKKCNVRVTLTAPGAERSTDPVELGQARAFGRFESDASPIATVVGVRNASERDRKSKDCFLVAIAPTRSRDGDARVAPYGIWTVALSTDSKEDICAEAWIERDDPIVEISSGRRQSSFVVEPQAVEDSDQDHHRPKAAVGGPTKENTLNSIATGKLTVAIGASVGEGSDARIAAYSSAGDTSYATGPMAVRAADESDWLSGRLAAGNASSSWIRMNGTSVAAPIFSRWLLEDATGRRVVRPKVPTPGETASAPTARKVGEPAARGDALSSQPEPPAQSPKPPRTRGVKNRGETLLTTSP